MNAPLRLSGFGLRLEHHQAFLERQPPVALVEVHSENFFVNDGQTFDDLLKVRNNYPVSLHGVGMSLGSTDEINWSHMQKLKQLITSIEPCLISDHLSWSSIEDQYFHDLLPLPFNQECLDHLVQRIQHVQDYLSRQILIENISQYVTVADSPFSEAWFLNEVATRSGCGILLDINNIYVSSMNLDFDPYRYIEEINPKLIQEIHLAGFTTRMINQKSVLIDTHSRVVAPAVWELYRYALKFFGRKITIVEWDSDLPPLDTLYLESCRAEQILREHHAITTVTN